MFCVDWGEMPSLTSVPDSFITGPMKDAPGEYVKVYIYLMMMSHCRDTDTSVESLSRIFSCPEENITDALKYWEKQKLLDIYYRSGSIIGIKLLLSVSEKTRDSHRLSNSRVRSLLSENEDARNIKFITEQYFGRPITLTELGTILYFMDELHFSLDLCDHLIQYCVDKGHTSIRYIEKVGLAWHKNGYTTVEEAKANSNNWSKYHFEVLKAFGIRDRNPIPKEIEYIDRWYKEYCFSIELISEACAIALASTGKQSFPYVDAILSNWHSNGVKTLADAAKLHEEHKQASPGTPKPQGTASKNQFHNFEQRTDDLDELARQLDRQFADNN